jgi:hypothetical protein
MNGDPVGWEEIPALQLISIWWCVSVVSPGDKACMLNPLVCCQSHCSIGSSDTVEVTSLLIDIVRQLSEQRRSGFLGHRHNYFFAGKVK